MEMTSVQEERRVGFWPAGQSAKPRGVLTYADLLFEEGKISKKIILINLNLRFSLSGSGFLHYILHDSGLNHEIAAERKE